MQMNLLGIQLKTGLRKKKGGEWMHEIKHTNQERLPNTELVVAVGGWGSILVQKEKLKSVGETV